MVPETGFGAHGRRQVDPPCCTGQLDKLTSPTLTLLVGRGAEEAATPARSAGGGLKPGSALGPLGLLGVGGLGLAPRGLLGVGRLALPGTGLRSAGLRLIACFSILS